MRTSIHSGGTGNIRHSPRDGLTPYSALFPGTNCCVDPVIRPTRWRRRELDACQGAPEPHGFAVRNRKRSSHAPSRPTASHLTFMTIAKRPSCWGGMRRTNHIFPKNGIAIFLHAGLDSASRLKGLGKSGGTIFAVGWRMSTCVLQHVGTIARRANQDCERRDRPSTRESRGNRRSSAQAQWQLFAHRELVMAGCAGRSKSAKVAGGLKLSPQ